MSADTCVPDRRAPATALAASVLTLARPVARAWELLELAPLALERLLVPEAPVCSALLVVAVGPSASVSPKWPLRSRESIPSRPKSPTRSRLSVGHMLCAKRQRLLHPASLPAPALQVR